MALERVWIGSVAAGREHEHEEFVEWLASQDGGRMFRQYRLNGYELREAGHDIVVTLRADEPPIIIHFLRNSRAWPDFWQFKSNAPSDAPAQTELRLQWRNDQD
jgi:hypothetical protein